MTIFYLDPVNGNDANAGTSFALRWKTLETGASAARIAPGDTIRCIASPDPTLVGNATWTDQSNTVTLAAAVTQLISDCETAWTASANVTATADATIFKAGTKSSKLAIASAFTTGKIAYSAVGPLDLSTYQQVTFWLIANAAIAAGTLSLRLCSDATGDVTVNTIPIPAIPFFTTTYTPLTIDLGAALGGAIQSVALYADLDPGTINVYLDNINAAKASGSANALTLNSLIGKLHNLPWVASSTYPADAIRRPTQANRTGFVYKVTAGGGGAAGAVEPTWPEEVGVTVVDGGLTWTCFDLEESWHAIQSINGTTVMIDAAPASTVASVRGYSGATETVATYKREPLLPALSNGTPFKFNEIGTYTANSTLSGGWDSVTMAAQSGETWISGRNAQMLGLYAPGGMSYWTIDRMNMVRCRTTFSLVGSSGQIGIKLYNSTFSHSAGHGIAFGSAPQYVMKNVQAHNNAQWGALLSNTGATRGTMKRCAMHNNLDDGLRLAGGTASDPSNTAWLNDCSFFNNAAFGIGASTMRIRGFNVKTRNNLSGAIDQSACDIVMVNSDMDESVVFNGLTTNGNFPERYMYSHKHGQVADAHLIMTFGGTIASATDQRHTGTGISWKFQPTSLNRTEDVPLELSVAKIVCAANTPINVNLWTYRDNANVNGKLLLRGGQLLGVPNDLSVACSPAINTWVQSASLNFTPTETGVVEVVFQVWDGVDTTNSFWIDDLSVA